MDAIREQIQKPLWAAIAGGIIGLIIGLSFAWLVWPLEVRDVPPEYLAFEEKVEYMRMAVAAYGRNGNVLEAQSRYSALGEDREEVFRAVASAPGDLSPDLLASFGALVVAGAPPVLTPGVPGQTTLPTTTPVAEGDGAGGFLSALLPVLCFLLLLVLAAALVFIYMRTRTTGLPRPGGFVPSMRSQQAARDTAYTDYTSTGAEPPMAQFMASYKLGDDLFDDSFSIDSSNGDFLGECGVGISETIGVGDPKKVTAFEVWLFDKNDIQTVTKVLMSDHAFNDDSIRQRLAAKGEPVYAQPGAETVLETQTLQMVARVVDMGYGEGPLPSGSFFDRFILELAVWPK
jgi:hypothetical protein